ncbi:hypothetical protein TNCV_4133451 [Trichonephila clavipes]|uniref:Uncharacterized protein n=1 Tax=Trichonephila clavipes TaxID=2585209 RepID=A0A8X6VH91_TRICX|nr:hypothetical protein TNCV_4133451 [Trichonephila clavipes]
MITSQSLHIYFSNMGWRRASKDVRIKTGGLPHFNDGIINGEFIRIYSFIVPKTFIYDGLYGRNCGYCEHIKDGFCFNGATSTQKC